MSGTPQRLVVDTLAAASAGTLAEIGRRAEPAPDPAVEPLRILIADSHPVFRHGLRALFDGVPDIDVVGEAATGREAVAAVTALAPQVVLMDAPLPDASGAGACSDVLRARPDTAVLILTMHDDAELVFGAVRAGARGYLLKDAAGTDVLRALRAVARGEAVFGPRVADRVIGFFTLHTGGGVVPFPQLTKREGDVLELLARGLGNPAIARRLTLSEKTVRNRVSDILAKLHVATRAEAVAVARDAGIGA
jgi:DNA-binding NarL/FixJ family response regulator